MNNPTNTIERLLIFSSMSTASKLNVLLAKTDAGSKTFNGHKEDYLKYFKGNQGAFKGEKRTYTANDGTIDEPTKRGLVRVATTVDEKLNWFVETNSDYINNVFAVEATNASGNAKAELKVGEVSFGTFSTLELLRMKSFLEDAQFRAMYENIPVRADNQLWEQSDNEMYTGRAGIFQTPVVTSINRTTQKSVRILVDPNVPNLKEGVNYTPKTTEDSTVVELGTGTQQGFSGEYTHRQRAEILRRIDLLKQGVIEALKVANAADVVPSEMTGAKLFNYIHTGTIQVGMVR